MTDPLTLCLHAANPSNLDQDDDEDQVQETIQIVQMLLEKRLSMVEDPGGLWSVLWARAVSESLMTGWSGKTSLPWRGRIKTFAISGGVIVVWIGGNEL